MGAGPVIVPVPPHAPFADKDYTPVDRAFT